MTASQHTQTDPDAGSTLAMGDGRARPGHSADEGCATASRQARGDTEGGEP